MNTVPTEDRVREILERKQAELIEVLRNRDGIAIEKSADQMDEIQYATERDLAIRNVDRESALLRQVKAALRRIHAAILESAWTANRRSARNASRPCHGRRVVSSARRLPTGRDRDGPDAIAQAA